MDDKLLVNSSLQELKAHGDLEYPVAIYSSNLREVDMGYVPWHWHEEIELVYVKKGAVSFFVGDDTIILNTGEAIFVNQNMLHALHPYGEDENRIISIVFHPAYLFGHGQTYLSSIYLLPILASQRLKYFILDKSLDNLDFFVNSLQQIFLANCSKEYGYELTTKSYLCLLWLELLKLIEGSKNRQELVNTLSLDEARVKQLMRFMEKHFAEPITLEDIASSIHISKSECCRCFKRVLKMTPFQYLMKYRIFESAKIIRSDVGTPLSVSELALAVGFNNISYFNKLFKEYMHCTPSQYKKLDKSAFTTSYLTPPFPII